jgi:hypothetical protein
VFTLIKAISRHHQRERQLAVDDTMTPYEDDDGWHADYRIPLPHGFSGRVFARTRAFGPPPHCSQASSPIVRIGGSRDRG